jgi:hypothetical protein
MTHELLPPDTTPEDAFQQYAADLEPLVAEKAPYLRPPAEDRVFLGRLADLAPSRPASAARLTPADQLWLRALEAEAHRHGVSYELVTHENGEDGLWLVPLH